MKKSSSILVKNNIDKNSIDSIAIGGFDGMHIAHQELFKNLNPKGAIISIETGYASITPKNYRQEYTKYPIFYYDLEDIKSLDGADFIDGGSDTDTNRGSDTVDYSAFGSTHKITVDLSTVGTTSGNIDFGYSTVVVANGSIDYIKNIENIKPVGAEKECALIHRDIFRSYLKQLIINNQL